MFLTFGGPNGIFLGRGRVEKLFWGLVEQLLFSIVPSILTFDLIFRYFFTCWGPNRLFFGSGLG